MTTQFSILKGNILVLAGFLLAYPAPAASPSLTPIYNFTSLSGDGANPYAGVIVSSSGVIYGTTEYGGGPGMGTVFELTPVAGGTSWTETIIHTFTGTDGSYPYAPLTIDSKGNLYGTTTYGGSSGLGTVFAMSPPTSPSGGWTFLTLHSFGGADGANPYAGVLLGTSGLLYGTTELGGTSNAGTVFKLKPAGGGAWTATVLYNFTGGKDGGYPYGGLIAGNNSIFYGTTNFGGKSIYGTVYQLVPPTGGGTVWTLTTIHSFAGGSDGGDPFSNLAIDASGALYGTTAGGIGCGNGTIFKLTPPASAGSPWTNAVLYRFSGGADGGHPRGPVVIPNSGTLYGTAFAGGTGQLYQGNGAIFQLTLSGTTWTESVLHTFTGGSDGGYPNASLIPAGNGSYYGSTFVGGSAGYGTVFNLVP